MKRPLVWLVALLSVTTLVYWPGLGSEFLYDDLANFQDLTRWTEGLIGWQAVVLEQGAGPLGRSLAMATFLFNAAISGMNPYWFKLTNLVLHLVIGLVVFPITLRLARRDRQLNRAPETAALLITAVWLLHPMMVGTVLYAVQRMAMLAALFMLLAVLAYLIGRERIEAGRLRSGALWIAAGVPGFTLLGALSKENALLAPMLCAVLEWVYFRPSGGLRRPLFVRSFLVIACALPLLACLLILAARPEFFLGGFENRPFTVLERLLTQARVLFDYAANLLLPIGPRMSLFRDDYAISTGLFSPWTTSLAVIAWVVAIGLAFGLRNKIPAFAAGLGLFLVGHALESTIFPLMLYFEHRNYLPSIGLFLATAGVLSYGYGKLSDRLDRPQVLWRGAVLALLVVLSSASFARATIWADNETLLTESLKRYPDSRTTRLALAEIEMNRFPPNLAAAQAHYKHLLALPRPSTQLIGAAGLLASSCHAGTDPDPMAIRTIMDVDPESLEADVLSSLTSLTEINLRSKCEEPGAAALAQSFERMIDASALSDGHVIAWQLRYRAAQLYAQAGMRAEARDVARKAWTAAKDRLPVAVLLVELAIQDGRRDEALTLLSAIEALLPAEDKIGQELLERYRLQVNSVSQ